MPATLGGVPGTPAARSSRGTQTRTLILDTALRMFREDGYEATTMRAVAAAAGVSVGNAYYYFESKEHLVQAYYEEIGRLHRSLALPRIAEVGGLADRLRIALDTHLEVIEPYHSFAGSFFKVAADPASPLSPFSPESAPARDEAIAFFRTVVEGSSARVPAALRSELPRLLWLLHMGVMLHWVYDRSPGARKSHQLVERVVPLVVKLVGLSRLPGLHGALDDALDLVRALGRD